MNNRFDFSKLSDKDLFNEMRAARAHLNVLQQEFDRRVGIKRKKTKTSVFDFRSNTK